MLSFVIFDKKCPFCQSSVILTHFCYFWIKLQKSALFWRFPTLPWNSKLYSDKESVYHVNVSKNGVKNVVFSYECWYDEYIKWGVFQRYKGWAEKSIGDSVCIAIGISTHLPPFHQKHHHFFAKSPIFRQFFPIYWFLWPTCLPSPPRKDLIFQWSL